MDAPRSWPPLSPFGTGIGCKCPRCGKGSLFAGLLEVRDQCAHCDLDLTPHDTGDGATVFVILILGAITVVLALLMESALAPPIWLHLVVWIPLISILSVALLRPFKGILIGMHYKNLRHKYEHGHDR
ncbi:MAG: DUF983 domain-containing protein [Alphaproteobacteria bacterium]|nr:DUF983 domain-containing protein [Alphaproteobacteria bacterium]